jgi:hypothetical protein
VGRVELELPGGVVAGAGRSLLEGVSMVKAEGNRVFQCQTEALGGWGGGALGDDGVRLGVSFFFVGTRETVRKMDLGLR